MMQSRREAIAEAAKDPRLTTILLGVSTLASALTAGFIMWISAKSWHLLSSVDKLTWTTDQLTRRVEVVEKNSDHYEDRIYDLTVKLKVSEEMFRQTQWRLSRLERSAGSR
jgi:hypothetical protein